MTKRLEVTLDRPELRQIRVDPQVIQNIETEDLSVEHWSETAVEKMFEAADEALKQKAD